jgi:hypothetical protein
VRSPSTAALDRKIKLPKYAAARVRHVWLVDPEPQPSTFSDSTLTSLSYPERVKGAPALRVGCITAEVGRAPVFSILDGG